MQAPELRSGSGLVNLGMKKPAQRILHESKSAGRALKLALSYEALISLKEDRGFLLEELHSLAELPALQLF